MYISDFSVMKNVWRTRVAQDRALKTAYPVNTSGSRRMGGLLFGSMRSTVFCLVTLSQKRLFLQALRSEMPTGCFHSVRNGSLSELCTPMWKLLGNCHVLHFVRSGLLLVQSDLRAKLSGENVSG